MFWNRKKPRDPFVEAVIASVGNGEGWTVRSCDIYHSLSCVSIDPDDGDIWVGTKIVRRSCEPAREAAEVFVANRLNRKGATP